MSDDDKNNVTEINIKKNAATPGNKTLTQEEKAAKKAAKEKEKQDQKDALEEAKLLRELRKIQPGNKEELLIAFLEDQIALPGIPDELVPWDLWFHREKNSDLSRIIKLDRVNRTVREIERENLKDEINNVFRRFASADGGVRAWYCLSDSQIKALANKLSYSGRKVRDCQELNGQWPKTTGFLSDPDYVFNRLPFDPSPGAVTALDFPTINKNLGHMTNSLAFCQRIGSIFDLDANRKKIVMLLGESNGGKSALLDLITYVAGGPDCVATVNLGTFAQFGMATLLDKRAWIGNEINPKFFINDKFKTIADPGPSLVGIERKGQGIFNSYVNGLMFCSANPKKMPRLEDDSGLRSRLIFCEISPIEETERIDPGVLKNKFHTELPFFIKHCLDVYSEFLRLKPGKEIQSEEIKPGDEGLFDQIVINDEMELDAVFDEYFLVDETCLGTDAKLLAKDYVKEWQRICNDKPAFGRIVSKRAFDNHVKKKTGTKNLSLPIKRDKVTHRYIVGIQKKGNA